VESAGSDARVTHSGQRGEAPAMPGSTDRDTFSRRLLGEPWIAARTESARRHWASPDDPRLSTRCAASHVIALECERR
jgi:hypothetical protein